MWQDQQLHWFSPDRSSKACLLYITSQYLSQEFLKYSPNILVRPAASDVKNTGCSRKKTQPKSLSTVWGSVIAVSRWNNGSAWDLHLMPKRQNPSEPLSVELRGKLPSFVPCLGITATLSKDFPLATFLFLSSSSILPCSTAKDQPPCPRVASSHMLPYQNLSGASTSFVALAQTS